MADSAWKKEKGFLTRDYKLKDFKAALDFVNKVGEIAESMNHHPDICIQSYNQVHLATKTHSEGKITDKDHTLAEKVDQLES